MAKLAHQSEIALLCDADQNDEQRKDAFIENGYVYLDGKSATKRSR